MDLIQPPLSQITKNWTVDPITRRKIDNLPLKSGYPGSLLRIPNIIYEDWPSHKPVFKYSAIKHRRALISPQLISNIILNQVLHKTIVLICVY